MGDGLELYTRVRTSISIVLVIETALVRSVSVVLLSVLSSFLAASFEVVVGVRDSVSFFGSHCCDGALVRSVVVAVGATAGDDRSIWSPLEDRAVTRPWSAIPAQKDGKRWARFVCVHESGRIPRVG